MLSTVIAGVAERIATQREAGFAWPEGVPCWFAVVLDGDDIVGTAMRTAPFGGYPAYLMPMPEEAVHSLSKALLDRDEPVLGANGALPAVQTFCEDMAEATGKTARVERAHAVLRARRPGRAAAGDRTAAPGHARRAGPGRLLVRGVHGRRRRAGRPRAGGVTARGTDRRGAADGGSGPAGCSSGSTRTTCRSTSPPRPLRRTASPGSGRSTRPRSSGEGLRECGRVRRLGAAPAKRRAALPVHRPGQSDLQQDLRGDRLPAGWSTWRTCAWSEASLDSAPT